MVASAAQGGPDVVGFFGEGLVFQVFAEAEELGLGAALAQGEAAGVPVGVEGGLEGLAGQEGGGAGPEAAGFGGGAGEEFLGLFGSWLARRWSRFATTSAGREEYS
jgi:hypothetical protein